MEIRNKAIACAGSFDSYIDGQPKGTCSLANGLSLKFGHKLLSQVKFNKLCTEIMNKHLLVQVYVFLV